MNGKILNSMVEYVAQHLGDEVSALSWERTILPHTNKCSLLGGAWAPGRTGNGSSMGR